MKEVPVLITWDVDPDTYIAYEPRHRSVDMALDLCQQAGVQSTFFITAKVDHLSHRQLERLGEHEIGCHGLTHWIDEEYNRMPAAMQRTYIEEATRKLEKMFAKPILSFRSPRVKTSGQTLKLLGDCGYVVDSSVCSQRIDFISSNLINPGWIVAPRRPYHPHRDNAFKQGDLPIWEVPVSAMVVPFISTSMRVFGLAFMKMFFRLLYAESRRSGKPIVYLAHTTELTGSSKPYIRLRHFSPSFIRIHGFVPRNVLYRMDGQTCLKATRGLLTHMASFPDVTFMTVSQYVIQHLGANPLGLDESSTQ
jgi:hypothetical protein